MKNGSIVDTLRSHKKASDVTYLVKEKRRPWLVFEELLVNPLVPGVQ